jgi:hypothetical protein
MLVAGYLVIAAFARPYLRRLMALNVCLARCLELLQLGKRVSHVLV